MFLIFLLPPPQDRGQTNFTIPEFKNSLNNLPYLLSKHFILNLLVFCTCVPFNHYLPTKFYRHHRQEVTPLH